MTAEKAINEVLEYLTNHEKELEKEEQTGQVINKIFTEEETK